jgi:hypothetical protein
VADERLSSPAPEFKSKGDPRLLSHLDYDIWMVQQTYQRFLNAPVSDLVIRNALIESFCMRARCIIELLEGNRKYTRKNYQPFSKASKDAKEVKRRLSSQIAHLRDSRIAETEISNRIGLEERAEILNILSAELTLFKAHLLPDYRHIAIRGLVPVTPPIHYTGPTTTTATTTSVAFGEWINTVAETRRDDC